MLQENTSALDNKTTAAGPGASAAKRQARPTREVSALPFPPSALLKFPQVSHGSSPNSITEVPVILSEMVVFSSKWIEITVPNHSHIMVPTRTTHHPKCSRKPVWEGTLRMFWVPSLLQQSKIKMEDVSAYFRLPKAISKRNA